MDLFWIVGVGIRHRHCCSGTLREDQHFYQMISLNSTLLITLHTMSPGTSRLLLGIPKTSWPFLSNYLTTQAQQCIKNPVSQQHPWRVCPWRLKVTPWCSHQSLSSVAQAIISSMPLGALHWECTKAAAQKVLTGVGQSWTVCLICLYPVTMNSTHLRMRGIKYWMLFSFMCWGIVRSGVRTKTSMMLSITSTFCHPHRAIAQHPRERLQWSRSGKDSSYQLHCLKMMTGLMADEVMAKFEMLEEGRDWFQLGGYWKTTFTEDSLSLILSRSTWQLEDAFIQGIPQSILFQGVLSNLITIWPGQLEDCHP